MKKAYLHWRFLSKKFGHADSACAGNQSDPTDRITPGRRSRLRPLSDPSGLVLSSGLVWPQSVPVSYGPRPDCTHREFQGGPRWGRDATNGGQTHRNGCKKRGESSSRRRTLQPLTSRREEAHQRPTCILPQATSGSSLGILEVWKLLWSDQWANWATTPLKTER